MGRRLQGICPDTLIDVDLRYIDYANTPLFGTKVVDGGLGWQSVFAVAIGVQYKATDRLTLLGGYLYNTNPVRNEATLFNVQAPGIITNTLVAGCIVQHHRGHHGLAGLGSRLPELDRRPDSAASGLVGQARCPDRHDLDGREHPLRPQED